MDIKNKNFKLIFTITISIMAVLLCTSFGIFKSVRSADAYPSPTPPPSPKEMNGVILKITDISPASYDWKFYIDKYDSVAKGTVVDKSIGEFVAANLRAWTLPAEAITNFYNIKFYIGIDGEIHPDQGGSGDVPVVPVEKLRGTLVKFFVQYHDGSTGYVEGYFDDNGTVSLSLDRMFDYITVVARYQEQPTPPGPTPGPTPGPNPDVNPTSPETGIFATNEF